MAHDGRATVSVATGSNLPSRQRAGGATASPREYYWFAIGGRPKGGKVKTLYYVTGGGDLFAFHLEQRRLALVKGGAGFKSLAGILAWAGEHDFEFVACCEPEKSQRVVPGLSQSGSKP
jgi:hypothetical protein